MSTIWLGMLALLSVNAACTRERVLTQTEHGRDPSMARDVATGGQPVRPSPSEHLTAMDTVGDVLRHRAFQGYARLLLPWDDRSYDEGMPLKEIGSLLPYHSHVEPGEVVGGLNRIIDDVLAGRQVFYAFYTEEEQRREPTKRHAGLFFFRGRPGAPFAVVSPGGGFAYVGSVHEGFPYAATISDAGYNAFVLKYRGGMGGAAATQDLAAALSFIVRRADALSVDRRSYSLWGSSAGARMAAAIGSHGPARFGGDDLSKPAAVIMAYTAHSDRTKDEPPTFVVVGENDAIAPPSAMAQRVAALRAGGTPVEFRRYPNVGHGFGSGADTSAEGWLGHAVKFWERFVPVDRRPINATSRTSN